MATIEVDGGHVAYWDWGTGPALVAIHGTGTPGELLTRDLSEFSREFRVITYDRRGYGESSESPRSWDAHGADLARVIEKLDAAPAVLFGYSGGSIAALDLAVGRPELVAGLVLQDPLVYTEHTHTPRVRWELLKIRLLRRLRGREAAAEEWIRFISSYSTGGSAWENALPPRRERILSNAAGILADLETRGGDHIDRGRLADIDVPVTLSETELSPPFMHRSVEELRRLMPQARVVTLENSSHVAILDARDQMLEILRTAMNAARAGANRAG